MKRQKRNWKKIVEECELSGLSTIDFCKSNGLSLSNFYARRKEIFVRRHEKLKTESPRTPKPTPTSHPTIDLVEIKPILSSKAEVQPTLRFTTPDGLSVEVYL